VDPLPDLLDPPLPEDERGRVRRVGVEIELTHLDVPTIAAIVAAVFDGAVSPETDYLVRVATDLGEFRVEADLKLLQRIGRHRAEHGESGALVSAAREAMAQLAEKIAPYEVVAPPVPYPSLPLFDELTAALRHEGGQGSDAGLLQALGLHLNPQVPRETADSIYAHLRAYAALEPWLRLRRAADVTRRLTPFADAYPEPYVEALLARAEAPPLPELIREYLHHNPTRNRGLDALPLFLHLDPDRVMAVVTDPRIKPRPTFHYRLPDSRLGDAGWHVTDEWIHWLVVERVAASPALMESLAGEYLALLRHRRWSSAPGVWAERAESLLSQIRFGLDVPQLAQPLHPQS
jgi:hypothetical protein